jgi:hypothetical protein
LPVATSNTKPLIASLRGMNGLALNRAIDWPVVLRGVGEHLCGPGRANASVRLDRGLVVVVPEVPVDQDDAHRPNADSPDALSDVIKRAYVEVLEKISERTRGASPAAPGGPSERPGLDRPDRARIGPVAGGNDDTGT